MGREVGNLPGGGGVKLVKVDPMHSGGTVAYRVVVDGRPVGWVGDGRPWCGHRFGGRKWFACWREETDSAARWDSGLAYPTRSAAVAALAELIKVVTR